jgi:hypothetical protein
MYEYYNSTRVGSYSTSISSINYRCSSFSFHILMLPSVQSCCSCECTRQCYNHSSGTSTSKLVDLPTTTLCSLMSDVYTHTFNLYYIRTEDEKYPGACFCMGEAESTCWLRPRVVVLVV